MGGRSASVPWSPMKIRPESSRSAPSWSFGDSPRRISARKCPASVSSAAVFTSIDTGSNREIVAATRIRSCLATMRACPRSRPYADTVSSPYVPAVAPYAIQVIECGEPSAGIR